MALNRKQRFVVLLAGCALVAAILFPPWVYVGLNPNHTRPAGYAAVFLSSWSTQSYGVRIDITRLLLECACITVVAGTLLVVSSSKPPEQ